MAEKSAASLAVRPAAPALSSLVRFANPTFIIVAAGIALRLFLLPLTMHGWDMPVLAWSARVVALGDLNVYDDGLRQWIQTGWNKPELTSPISHGPLFFYIYGAWLWLMGVLGLFPVQSWTSADPTGLNALNISVLKIPHLAFDLLGAFFMAALFRGKQRLFALGIWLFMPLLVFTSYAWGQNDVFMVACIAGGIYFGAKALEKQAGSERLSKEAYFALAMFGAGVCFKLYPVFFLPVAALILGKRANRTFLEEYRRSLALFGVGLLPMLGLFVPLLLTSKFFLSSVLFSWEANLLSTLGFNNGAGFFSVYWGLYLGILALLVLANGRGKAFSRADYFTYLAAVIFAYGIVADYPVRFLIWMLPLLLVLVVEQPRLFPAYLLINLCFVPGMINQNMELNTVWSYRDKEIFLMGSGKSYLMRILPWQQVTTVATALFVIALVALFVLYTRANHTFLFAWTPRRSGLPEDSRAASDTAPYAQNKATLEKDIPHWGWWLLPAVAIFGFLALLFVLAANDSGVRKLNQEKSRGSFTALSKGTLVEQPFVAPAGKLEKMEISFATYSRYNLSSVDFVLYKDEKPRLEVARLKLDGLLVKNSDYYTIKLPRPLELSQPTPLVFSLSSLDGTRETSLGLFSADFKTINQLPPNPLPWRDEGSKPNDRVGLNSPALLNGQPTDQILVFRADYAVDWGAKLNFVQNYLGKTPLFSLAFFGFCALLSLVAVGLLLFNRLGRHSHPVANRLDL